MLVLSTRVEKAAAPKVKAEKKRKDPNAPKGALTAYILFRYASKRRTRSWPQPDPTRPLQRHTQPRRKSNQKKQQQQEKVQRTNEGGNRAHALCCCASASALLSNAKRDGVKKDNPDIAFGAVGQSTRQISTQPRRASHTKARVRVCATFLFLAARPLVCPLLVGLTVPFCLCLCFLSYCPAKKISELWKAISPSEKKKFEAAAADDKKRHEKEMADYKARGGAGGHQHTHTHIANEKMRTRKNDGTQQEELGRWSHWLA